MNRRHFLSVTSASLGSLSLARGEDLLYQPPEDETVRISLLHTTDLHGHILPTTTYEGVENVGGFGRCLTQIRKWQKSSKNRSLTLDIGDLYQGTHVSLETEGSVMIDLLNAANYDAWVAGNHDFDWGEDIFRNAVRTSAMPVLSNNLSVDGFATGHKHHQKGSPYANLVPSMIKEVDGIKIGVFGITTPGLSFWLNPGQLGSVKALDPLQETQRVIKNLKAQGCHCIIAAGHMGLKRRDDDDYANQVNRILSHCPEIDVYIAGHTHRERGSTVIGQTLFTQAGYYGIWAGRVDLTFHREKNQLLRRDAETVLMDESFDIDPMALQIAGKAMGESDKALAAKVGKLDAKLEKNDSRALIAAGMIHAMKKRGIKLDGVLHGTFSDDVIEPGDKTLGDLWKIVPYENRIVTAQVTGDQIIEILRESMKTFGNRRLIGFKVDADWDKEARKYHFKEVLDRQGKEISPSAKYTIGFNSYDAQSGGRKLLGLREILSKPAAKAKYHPIDTRAAMADYFLDTEVVTAKGILDTTGA